MDLYRQKLRKMMYLGLFFATVFVGIHTVASDLSLYWIIWWLDIPMHILGGMVVSGSIIWFIHMYYNLRHYQDILSTKTTLVLVLCGVLCIGILWEYIESLYGLSGLATSYRLDTISDICNDMMGALLGFISWKLIFKYI